MFHRKDATCSLKFDVFKIILSSSVVPLNLCGRKCKLDVYMSVYVLYVRTPQSPDSAAYCLYCTWAGQSQIINSDISVGDKTYSRVNMHKTESEWKNCVCSLRNNQRKKTIREK